MGWTRGKRPCVRHCWQASPATTSSSTSCHAIVSRHGRWRLPHPKTWCCAIHPVPTATATTACEASMQRHEMMQALTGLGLKGMAGAFDEAVTTGLQRKRTTLENLTDLLRAEPTNRHAASVHSRMNTARPPGGTDRESLVFDSTPNTN